VSPARRGLAIAAILCASACQVGVRRAGDDRFLSAELAWEPGVTTAREVARALGPPDAVRASCERMSFVYRFERRADARLALSFYLKLFQRQREREQHSTLLVAFDAADRLLYWGRSDLAEDDLAGDLGLD
jgi:hypothetical protein